MEDNKGTRPATSLNIIIRLRPGITVEQLFEDFLAALGQLRSLSGAIPDQKQLISRALEILPGLRNKGRASTPAANASPTNSSDRATTKGKFLKIGLSYTQVQLDWFKMATLVIATRKRAGPGSVVRWLASRLHQEATRPVQLISWYQEARGMLKKDATVKVDLINVSDPELAQWITESVDFLFRHQQKVSNAAFARCLIEWGRHQFPDTQALQAHLKGGEPSFLTPALAAMAEPLSEAAPAASTEINTAPARSRSADKINLSKKDFNWANMVAPIIAARLGVPNSLQSVATWVLFEAQSFFDKYPKKLEQIFRRHWNAANGVATLTIDFAIPAEVQSLRDKLNSLAKGENEKVSWSSLTRFAFLWLREQIEDERDLEQYLNNEQVPP